MGARRVKRKRSDRPEWRRVTRRRFCVECLDSEDFSGYVTLLCIDEAREPLWILVGDSQLCVADSGFSWLQHFPASTCYTVTTMFDSTGRVVQWYIDVCKQHGIDESGIPWYDDLYLDIAMLPSGETKLLDADELDRALREGSVSGEDHDLAWREATRLIADIQRGSLKLLRLGTEHRDRLLWHI